MTKTISLSADQLRVLALLRDQLQSLNLMSRSVKLSTSDARHGRALALVGLAVRTRDNQYECTVDGFERANQ